MHTVRVLFNENPFNIGTNNYAEFYCPYEIVKKFLKSR